MNRKGFSLVELAVILIIVGILSVFAFIAFDPYKGVKLDSAAKKVVADLQYTRNLAQSTSKWYGISFQPDPDNIYFVYQTDGTTDTTIENPSNLGKDFIVDLHNYYSGVTINSVDISGGTKVEFHPLGEPYNDKNGSAIASAGSIILGYSSLTREVNITPTTGRITD